MSTKVPEKIFVNSFLNKLEKFASQWSTKYTDDGQIVLDTTTHNTALVLKALRESAKDAGYISLMFALISCKVDELPEDKEKIQND